MILLCIEIGPRYCMQYASVRFRAEGPSGLKTGPSGIARPASAPKPGRPRSPTPVYNRASSAPPSAAGPASAGAGYCTTTDRSGSDRSTSNSRLAWVMAQTVCEKNRVRRSVPRSPDQVRGQALAYSVASSASSVADGPGEPRANSDGTPSSAVFFQAWIWLAWTPNRLDSSATSAVLAKRSQSHLRLEVSAVFLSYVRHRSPLATWPC